MKHAALITTTGDHLKRVLPTAYPRAANRLHTIRNGSHKGPIPPIVDDGVFRITYVGSLYLDRSPENFFRAVRGVHRTSPGA